MTWHWLALAGLALVALATVVSLVRVRRRTTAQIEAARAEAAELRARLARLEQQRAEAERAPVRDERHHTITGLGGLEPGAGAPSSTTPAEPGRLERTVFADLVLRESVIRIGALVHGVRRGLAAETRNRIRFEMKREVKRARKQRRAEQREAYREWQARQRDALTDDDLDDRFRESA